MITVIAGVNGAGKSSIAGSAITAQGGQYFNPDVVARDIQNKKNSSIDEANGEAWNLGKDLLEHAIAHNSDYTFETTLGGNTITSMFLEAGQKGVSLRIFYCGLSSPDLHIERVAARVARGGHPIPDEKIHARWKSSAFNMMQLIPVCEAVTVWDNSITCNMGKPVPQKIFSFTNGVFDVDGKPSMNTPEWAKPLVAAAINANVKMP